MTVHPRWIRLALRVLPNGFRSRFGRDLADAASDLSTDARRAGGVPRQLAYVVRELVAMTRLAWTSRRITDRTRRDRDHEARAVIASLLDDVRWAIRHARRRPVFALAVTVTLGITMAATTVAFGLATAVLWRPLPFADAASLVFVWESADRDGQTQATRVTGARYAAWRDVDAGFASLSLFGAAGFTMETAAGAVSVRGVRVSANYFDTLGIRPAWGRTFSADDEVPGNHRVVVLSHGFWQERLGGRREAIGETLHLSGEPYRIVGVMPPHVFPGWPVNPAVVTLDPAQRELWVPIPRTPALDQNARAHVFGVLGRLAPDISAEDAVGRLDATADPAAPDPHRARLEPLRRQLVSDGRMSLLTLGWATLALLLIACTNLAALYASGFDARRAELAVRVAIGASVARLVRQLAIETGVLALGAAVGGLVMARLALAAAPRFVPASIPLLTRPSLDGWMVALAVGLSLAAGTLLAAWPMARLVMSAPTAHGAVTRPRHGIYRGLVVTQVAVTLALATTAGLLAQSLYAVRSEHPGLAVEGVFVADVGLPSTSPQDGRAIAATEQRLLTTLAAIPGVEMTAAAYDHPLEANWSEAPLVLGDATRETERRQAELRIVSPGYFDALDVTLLDGRVLTDRDRLGLPGAAVVNEAFARQLGGRALGRRIRSGTPRFLFPDAPDEFEIVGIVDNERFRGLEAPAQPAFYLSTRQFPQTTFSILVRSSGDPLSLAPEVRSGIRSVHPAITVDRPTSLERVLAEQLVARRLTTEIIGGFAAAALGLAALGIFGLLAGSVGSRRREIGVRLAVGATPGSIARTVVGDSLRSVGAGIALGCGLALLSGRLIQSLLVGVSPRDPVTLAGVVVLLLATAIVAALVPASRAARVDPVVALRPE